MGSELPLEVHESPQELASTILRLAGALRHLRIVATEHGSGTELWNALMHEGRAKRDDVWSPDLWPDRADNWRYNHD